MSQVRKIVVHSVAEDGVPDMEAEGATGRVAYIWDGAVVSGWPVRGTDPQQWEPSEDRHGGPVTGVTHWVEFDVPAWQLGERSP